MKYVYFSSTLQLLFTKIYSKKDFSIHYTVKGHLQWYGD